MKIKYTKQNLHDQVIVTLEAFDSKGNLLVQVSQYFPKAEKFKAVFDGKLTSMVKVGYHPVPKSVIDSHKPLLRERLDKTLENGVTVGYFSDSFELIEVK